MKCYIPLHSIANGNHNKIRKLYLPCDTIDSYCEWTVQKKYFDGKGIHKRLLKPNLYTVLHLSTGWSVDPFYSIFLLDHTPSYVE